MGFAKLGINIDHVATLREARCESYPSLIDFSEAVLQAGADQITLHLREDRRHIQDTDLEAINLVTKKYGKILSMEMVISNDIAEVVQAISPARVCFVPMQGGFTFNHDEENLLVAKTIKRFRAKDNAPLISLYVEPTSESVKKATAFVPAAIELHAKALIQELAHGPLSSLLIDELLAIREITHTAGAELHCAHGLTEEYIDQLDRYKIFDQFNIGHFIICQSLFEGVFPVVNRISKKLKGGLL